MTNAIKNALSLTCSSVHLGVIHRSKSFFFLFISISLKMLFAVYQRMLFGLD